MTKSNVAPGVQAQQTAELRQQVNSQPFKPAQIVGKVELKPRVEVKLQPVNRNRPKPQQQPRQERPRGMKRADDNRAQVAGNAAMLQELNFVKKQPAEAKT